MMAEGLQDAVTRSEPEECMSRTYLRLYADKLHFVDLTLLAYPLGALQTMLNRLGVYASSEHLTINTEFKGGPFQFKARR